MSGLRVFLALLILFLVSVTAQYLKDEDIHLQIFSHKDEHGHSSISLELIVYNRDEDFFIKIVSEEGVSICEGRFNQFNTDSIRCAYDTSALKDGDNSFHVTIVSLASNAVVLDTTSHFFYDDHRVKFGGLVAFVEDNRNSILKWLLLLLLIRFGTFMWGALMAAIFDSSKDAGDGGSGLAPSIPPPPPPPPNLGIPELQPPSTVRVVQANPAVAPISPSTPTAAAAAATITKTMSSSLSAISMGDSKQGSGSDGRKLHKGRGFWWKVAGILAFAALGGERHVTEQQKVDGYSKFRQPSATAASKLQQATSPPPPPPPPPPHAAPHAAPTASSSVPVVPPPPPPMNGGGGGGGSDSSSTSSSPSGSGSSGSSGGGGGGGSSSGGGGGRIDGGKSSPARRTAISPAPSVVSKKTQQLPKHSLSNAVPAGLAIPSSSSSSTTTTTAAAAAAAAAVANHKKKQLQANQNEAQKIKVKQRNDWFSKKLQEWEAACSTSMSMSKKYVHSGSSAMETLLRSVTKVYGNMLECGASVRDGCTTSSQHMLDMLKMTLRLSALSFIEGVQSLPEAMSNLKQSVTVGLMMIAQKTLLPVVAALTSTYGAVATILGGMLGQLGSARTQTSQLGRLCLLAVASGLRGVLRGGQGVSDALYAVLWRTTLGTAVGVGSGASAVSRGTLVVAQQVSTSVGAGANAVAQGAPVVVRQVSNTVGSGASAVSKGTLVVAQQVSASVGAGANAVAQGAPVVVKQITATTASGTRLTGNTLMLGVKSAEYLAKATGLQILYLVNGALYGITSGVTTAGNRLPEVLRATASFLTTSRTRTTALLGQFTSAVHAACLVVGGTAEDLWGRRHLLDQGVRCMGRGLLILSHGGVRVLNSARLSAVEAVGFACSQTKGFIVLLSSYLLTRPVPEVAAAIQPQHFWRTILVVVMQGALMVTKRMKWFQGVNFMQNGGAYEPKLRF